ncbi:MAG: selenocysteine-specific translation elongation factor [Ilumatobacteraceae bacterium]
MPVIATAGHVDHGKSSLVQALTGTNPDRFEEERRRGLTIDLGFAHCRLPSGAELSFVDVPGHVRFVGNMLAGVADVDACVFVVAATEGWKPQSEEHLRILQLLGLRHGLVVLTMSDLVDDEWLQLQQLEVRDRLAGTFLADAPMVQFSSRSGAGMVDLVAALETLASTTPAAADRGRPRLWIDRVFAAKGSGTVVTGTLTGGSVVADQHLQVVPGGVDVRVRGLQTHGRQVPQLAPGNRAALNLVGISYDRLARGDALVVDAQWRPTMRFDASLHVLATVGHDVSRRGAYVVHIGSGEFVARVRVLGLQVIAPGGDGLVRMHLAQPLPLVPGDRFVLRESGRSETVGGGEVLDVAPVLPASKARPDRDVHRVVAERGVIDVDELQAITGEGQTATVGHWVMSASTRDAYLAGLRAQLADAVDGLDVSLLDGPRRALLAELGDVRVDAGIARLMTATDPYSDHPFVERLLEGGSTPPDPDGVERNELRELVRRGVVVERDGIYFHPDAVDAAAQRAAALLRVQPDGFTVGELREALGTSRKYAVPLAGELDARGITRRRGDRRIAGPRLPSA